ncbi:hypothetical protein CUMW_018690 [Citrus unshiu]|nr:hypothetical protein CUMW_018690 [Citrus unshiu]
MSTTSSGHDLSTRRHNHPYRLLFSYEHLRLYPPHLSTRVVRVHTTLQSLLIPTPGVDTLSTTLLSLARSTFPNLINFRVAKLHGFRRVFAHVAPIFFERGIAKPETKEISSLSVEPCEGETLIVTVFEIQKSEIPAFIKREHEFRFLAEAKRYIFIIMGDTTLIRFGGMISYLAVFIFGIVIAVLFHPAQYALAASTNLRRGNSKLNPTRNLVSLYWKKNDLTLV